jgi:hypothetical protein
VGWPVYSERLLASPGHVGWVFLDVPVGRRAVVKQIAVVNYGQVAAYVQVAIAGSAVWGRSVPGPLNSLQDSGMWVGYGGEQLGIYCEVAGVGVSLHGYLFHATAASVDDAKRTAGVRLAESDGPVGAP